MFELLVALLLIAVIVFVLLGLFSVFVAYLTQASYVNPLDDDWNDDV